MGGKSKMVNAWLMLLRSMTDMANSEIKNSPNVMVSKKLKLRVPSFVPKPITLSWSISDDTRCSFWVADFGYTLDGGEAGSLKMKHLVRMVFGLLFMV